MFPMLRRDGWLSPNFKDTFGRLRNELETMFDRGLGSDGGFLSQSWGGVPFTIWEDDDFYIEADLPGVSESDVDVTVHNGLIHIRGERKAEEGRNYLFNGRSFGRFERVVTLPAAATDEIEASMSNGVLSVVLKKSVEAKPKRITVHKAKA
jgi:HSP20 family protein